MLKLRIIIVISLPLVLPGNSTAQTKYEPVSVLEYKVAGKTNAAGVATQSVVSVITNAYLKGNPHIVPFVPTEGMRVFSLGTNQTKLPFPVTMVDTPETKEQRALMKQATVLLQAKNYDQLEDLAAKYRSSKEHYADGFWKLNSVYCGFPLSDQAADKEWGIRISALKEWVMARPDSITARVALADVLVSYAWKARGGDWADRVSQEGWRLFSQRLNQAAITLSEAKRLKQKCPFYWSVLMTDALGLQVEKPRFNAIFDQAVNLEPEYEFYHLIRAQYLLPRWYGNPGEWEKELTRSADLIGSEDGDMLYARVVWGAHQCVSITNLFKENNLSWPRVDKGFGIIEKRFPDSLAAKNERAYLACLAGDYQKARYYFDQTQGQVDLSVWRQKEKYISFATMAYVSRYDFHQSPQ